MLQSACPQHHLPKLAIHTPCRLDWSTGVTTTHAVWAGEYLADAVISCGFISIKHQSR